MTAHLVRILDKVTRVRGVRGAMLVGAEDGLVIAESLMEGVRGNALAALAAALAARLERAAAATGVGTTTFVHLEAARGALLLVPAGQGVLLVTITDTGVNLGLARLEMLRAVAEVA